MQHNLPWDKAVMRILTGARKVCLTMFDCQGFMCESCHKYQMSKAISCGCTQRSVQNGCPRYFTACCKSSAVSQPASVTKHADIAESNTLQTRCSCHDCLFWLPCVTQTNHHVCACYKQALNMFWTASISTVHAQHAHTVSSTAAECSQFGVM